MSLKASIVEDAARESFAAPGQAVGHGPLLAPGAPATERDGLGDVVPGGGARARSEQGPG
jgi:hypothetical protein